MVPQRSVLTARTSAMSSSGSYVTIKHPIEDRVEDESNKSSTTASGQAITLDSGIACELLDKGIQAEFGLLDTGDQHFMMMQEVQQFSEAVKDAVAVELQEPTSKAGPRAAVLVWAGKLCPMERESLDKRVERVFSKLGGKIKGRPLDPAHVWQEGGTGSKGGWRCAGLGRHQGEKVR